MQISERAQHGSVHVVWEFPTPLLRAALSATVISYDKRPRETSG